MAVFSESEGASVRYVGLTPNRSLADTLAIGLGVSPVTPYE